MKMREASVAVLLNIEHSTSNFQPGGRSFINKKLLNGKTTEYYRGVMLRVVEKREKECLVV